MKALWSKLDRFFKHRPATIRHNTVDAERCYLNSMATARSANEIETDAQYLYARLYAPCCWAQTLDVHYSQMVNELRSQIRMRLESGMSREDLVASLVKQYGARIVASQPSTSTAALLFAGAAVIGCFPLVFILKRRHHNLNSTTALQTRTSQVVPPVASALYDKLDEELDKSMRSRYAAIHRSDVPARP